MLKAKNQILSSRMPKMSLKPHSIKKPVNADKIKFGRKLFINDSWGSYVKNPIVEEIERGFKRWEIEPHIRKKIRASINKTKNDLKKDQSLKTSALSFGDEGSNGGQILSMSGDNIKLGPAFYTPNPFPRSLGGECNFLFKVYFTDTLPPNYDFNVSLFLRDDLKVSVTKAFNTSDFSYNPETQRYETENYSNVRIPASSFNEAYSEETIGSNLTVFLTAMDASSSDDGRFCSGVEDDCVGFEDPPCDCCKDCNCEQKIIPCEGGATTKSCRDEPECSTSPSSCSGGSCQTRGNGAGSLHHLPGDVNSNVSLIEGKLRIISNQLADGEHELFTYYSSINVLDPIFNGWYFGFNESLLEDPVDKSLLTRFNTKIGTMRFIYDHNSDEYKSYKESVKAKIIRDDVNNTVTLYYEDNSSSTYQAVWQGPNLPYSYHLLEKADSKGRSLVKYENWMNEWWPLKITDREGRVISGEWVHQEGIRYLTYTDWLGRKYRYSFSTLPSSRLQSYIDPYDNVVEYKYDETEVPDFLGPKEILYNGEVKAEYEGYPGSTTRLGVITYPEGTKVSYDYDFTGGVIKEYYNDEGHNEYVFDKNLKLTSKIDVEGKSAHYSRDEEGRLTSITTFKCGVGTEEYTYDERGNILTYTDVFDNVTAYEYNDPHNPDKPTKITGPAPFLYETHFTYDPDEGWLISMTDALERVISYTYYTDEARKGLKHTETDHMGRTTEYDYDEWQNIKWIKDPLERYAYFSYDDKGRLQSETDIFGRTTCYYRDENGSPIMIKDYQGKITRMEYDHLARLTKITAPDGTLIRYSYDSEGNTVTITDSYGNTARREFNQQGKVVRETDAKGYITRYEYDYYGNLIKIIDPMLRERTYEYDLQGRLVKMTDPLGRETAYSCDDYCSVNTVTDPNGWVTKYYYDVKCQLTKIEYHDGSFYQFAYDQLGRKTAETGAGGYYGSTLYGGQVYGGVKFGQESYGGFKYQDTVYYGFNPANTIYYEYDAGDRLIKVTYPGNAVISYEYDLLNRITKISDAGGMELTYVYDDDHDGRIFSVTKGNKTVTYTYDDEDEGKLKYINLPNGIKKEIITNEETGRLITIVYSRQENLLYRFDYEYYDNGNISRKIVTKPNGARDIYDYNYDIINRLVSTEENSRLKTWYDFDPMGNRLKKKTMGVNGQGGLVQGSCNYDYNACDELNCCNEIRFSYDMNGNMTEKKDPVQGAAKYQYNYQGRLMRIVFPDGAESLYNYNSEGLRLKKRDKAGVTVNSHWASGISSVPEVLDEADADGKIITNYFPGIGFKSIYNGGSTAGGGQWRFFITDHLGSVIALTDETGNITDQYEYDEYGAITTKTGTSYNTRFYIGQEYDQDSELVYLRARYYDPRTGRFVSRDPIGIKGSLNFYEYTKANPVYFYDISGLDSQGDGWFLNYTLPWWVPIGGKFYSPKWWYASTTKHLYFSVFYQMSDPSALYIRFHYFFALIQKPPIGQGQQVSPPKTKTIYGNISTKFEEVFFPVECGVPFIGDFYVTVVGGSLIPVIYYLYETFLGSVRATYVGVTS